MSGRMKLSGSNIFWKNALEGLQKAVFLKPNAPRSVFLWRLGCNASRKIRLRGDCEADLAKLIAPRFFHLPKLAAPHSSSLGHIYHVGISGLEHLKTISGSHSNISGTCRRNQCFARTVKPAAGLPRGRLLPNPPPREGQLRPTRTSQTENKPIY